MALVVALSTNTCTAADECFRLTSVGSCWTRRCRKDQFISSFETVFQPENGDRVWKICCRNIQMPSAELSAVTCNPWTSEYIFISSPPPPTSQKLEGYIAFESFVVPSVTRSRFLMHTVERKLHHMDFFIS